MLTVQNLIDIGDTYFWFCKRCDHGGRLNLLRFRDKFGPEHGATPTDFAARLRCTRCKSQDIGLMMQEKGKEHLMPMVVPVGPVEKVEYRGHRGNRHIDMHASGSCIYSIDKEGNTIEIAAWAMSSGVARAAFEELKKAYPERRFQ